MTVTPEAKKWRDGREVGGGAARAADDSSYLILNIDIFMCVLKRAAVCSDSKCTADPAQDTGVCGVYARGARTRQWDVRHGRSTWRGSLRVS